LTSRHAAVSSTTIVTIAQVLAITTTHDARQVSSADVIVADLSFLRATATDDGVELSTQN
jgi:nucleoside 2-deoxyribosyltransferase